MHQKIGVEKSKYLTKLFEMVIEYQRLSTTTINHVWKMWIVNGDENIIYYENHILRGYEVTMTSSMILYDDMDVSALNSLN